MLTSIDYLVLPLTSTSENVVSAHWSVTPFSSLTVHTEVILSVDNHPAEIESRELALGNLVHLGNEFRANLRGSGEVPQLGVAVAIVAAVDH